MLINLSITLFILLLLHSVAAATSSNTIVKSVAQWQLLPPIPPGAGRLVVFSISDPSLCPDCMSAESLLTSAGNLGAPIAMVTVLCDHLPPGHVLCSRTNGFPHVAGYTVSNISPIDDDHDDEEDSSSTLTLDLSASSTVNLGAIGQWALGLQNDATTAEDVAQMVSQSHTNAGDISLHTYTPRVKSIIVKDLESEMAKNDVSIVLLGTSECWKCAEPLMELEKLSNHLALTDSSSDITIRRAAIDANLRAELGIADTVDVPLLLMYHAKTLCDSKKSQLLSTGEKWSTCRPIIYNGGTSYQDILRYIQREFLAAPDSVLSTKAEYSKSRMPLSVQINSLEQRKSTSSHNIHSVFNRKSTAKHFTSWIRNCKTSTGCYLQLLSTWYVPLSPILQQQLNLFIGASNGESNQVPFAIVDLNDVSSHTLAVISSVLSGSNTDAPITSFCPNAACTLHITKNGISTLPMALSVEDFEQDTPTKVEARHFLTRGSRFLHIVTEEIAYREGQPFPTSNNKLFELARQNQNHILALYVPKEYPGHVVLNQLSMRSIQAFEELCDSMNATNNLNSGEGDVRCFVMNAKATKTGGNTFTFPTVIISKGGSDSVINGMHSAGGRTPFERSLNFVRNPLAFELSLCKDVNISCRPQRFVRPLLAGTFEEKINDLEFAKFVLFAGGPSCPHTPLLLHALERVARVHSRDRHEIIVYSVDATSELHEGQRKLFDVDKVPQLRFYPKGVQTLKNGVQVGERYVGPSNAESIFEFIHFEMGYAYLDYDYRRETSITSITGRNFEDEFVNDHATNKSHSLLFLYDTVLNDRFTLDILNRLDKQYFNNENISTPLTKKVDFFKMDGRRFAKLVLKHHLHSFMDLTKGQLPQLLFLPKGGNKLRKVILFGQHQRYSTIGVADFIVQSVSSFSKEEYGNATSLFNFTNDEIREKSDIDEDSTNDEEPLVKHLTLTNFKDFVGTRGDRIVLFYTSSCQFCKSYKMHFQNVAAHFTGDIGIKFGSLNLDEHSEIGHVQGIQTIPAVKVFFEGSVDKATDYRGEDYMGMKNSSEPLVEYITSIRGTPKVAELDQFRALRDEAIPTIQNMSSLETLIGKPTGRTVEFIFDSDGEDSSADNNNYLFDDKEFLAPVAVSVTMENCGHCFHLSNVLVDAENYFLRSPLPRPKTIPQDKANIRFVKMDGTTNSAIAKRFGIEEFPVLLLFYTQALSNGTMRHVSVKFNGPRNIRSVGDFLVKYLNTAIAPELMAEATLTAPQQQEDETSEVLDNPFMEEAVNQQQQFEDDEMNAVLNESIPVFSGRLLRTALIRTSVILILTLKLPRDQPFVLVMNEVHRVLSEMSVVTKGYMSTAVFPDHLINNEVEGLTGWSSTSNKPYITLVRGLAQPQIVHFNATSMKGVGEAPPPGAEEMFYDQPTPQLILTFLDKYAKEVFVLPRNLNDTSFMANIHDLQNPSGKLSRWAVLLTEYDCKLCHKMIQSASYSAQAQMALHDPSIDITVLDINRARHIYKQWGSPKLPALLLFERPPHQSGSLKENKITFAKKFRIDDYEEGEEALAVPKRRQVHEFIMGISDRPFDTLRPSVGFFVDAKTALRSAASALKGATDEDSLRSIVGGDIIKVGTASDLEHAMRQLSGSALILFRGDICKSCQSIQNALLTALLATTSVPRDLLKPVKFIEVYLPIKSRQMERELVTMGFAQLSTPSVYLVSKRQNQLKPAVVKFNGNKEAPNSLLSFVLDTITES